MAREIKPTPILEGQDVIDFYEKLATLLLLSSKTKSTP